MWGDNSNSIIKFLLSHNNIQDSSDQKHILNTSSHYGDFKNEKILLSINKLKKNNHGNHRCISRKINFTSYSPKTRKEFSAGLKTLKKQDSLKKYS